MNDELLRIGDVARLAGVTRRTVDFYTHMGLLEPAQRTQSNYRLYPRDAVASILLIRRLEAEGVTLAEIATALRRRNAARDEVERSLAELTKEIGALRKAVKTLPAVGGLAPTGAVSAVTERVRSLIETAIEITGGSIPPV